jgi:hypothetical protein
VGIWHRGIDAYVAQLGGGRAESFRPVGEFIAANDLTRIFKVLLALASPATIARRAGMLWERYYDVGAVVTRERGRSHFVLELTAPADADKGVNQLLCSVGIASWMESALAIAGARSVRGTHGACRFHGAPKCEIALQWDE